MKLLSASESRELDRLSREKYGIESYALMTRAGESVASSAARHWPDAIRNGVLVLAGKGNNGGDGFVAGRRLIQDGANVSALLLGRTGELKGDAKRAHDDFTAAGGAVIEAESESGLADAIGRGAVIVDAIFGTGLNAEVAGLPRRAIELVNQAGTSVIAVDIASGVNSDAGAVMGVAVRADVSVTFGFAKFGHMSYPGAGLCGALEIADIGFAPGAVGDLDARGLYVEAEDIRALLKPRPMNSHKGMYGHPLIIAASRGKSGAALLTSRAALRTGAGLATAAIPESAAAIVASGQAELMTEPMPDLNGHFEARATIERLGALTGGNNVIITGPGIGVSRDTRELIEWLVETACELGRPLIIDADGLNVLAQIGPDFLRRSKGPIILTPHPGEMGRLLGCSAAKVNADRISSARRLAELTGANVLLKGNRSVMANPPGEIAINSSGNPGMSTPGMGDALSGIIGALAGQGLAPFDALKLGVFVHGYAADRVASQFAPVGYLTGDMIEEIPRALSALLA
ncbi:MAG: NAD(P)H-hydrate dehydratase [Candidatus Binataceae bacterium]